MYFENPHLSTSIIKFDVACSCIVDKYKEESIEHLTWYDAAKRLRRLTLPSNAGFIAKCNDHSVINININFMMEVITIETT